MLKVKFWRIENVILMKILEQDGIERGDFEWTAVNGVIIRSNMSPDIIDTSILYLRGTNIYEDHCISMQEYATIEEAKKQLKLFYDAIKELNEELSQDVETDEEDDDIEMLIVYDDIVSCRECKSEEDAINALQKYVAAVRDYNSQLKKEEKTESSEVVIAE